MRIAQIIDTLGAGGAERMAVSFANALSAQISCSALIATRAGGPMKEGLIPDVQYLNAARRSTFDVRALQRASSFIRKNRISILHAHGTSFFFATLIKCLNPSLKVIYHEHFGARAHLRTPIVLKFLSGLFSTVIVVNDDLKKWAVKQLHARFVYFLPNYAEESNPAVQEDTLLSGTDGKRIIMLANLKEPKNHLFALKSFASNKNFYPEWSLHFVGADYDDSYSKQLKDFVIEESLDDMVYFYGQRSDVSSILAQCSIGMLCSDSEGFPVTLLEYGIAALPVLSTNVGYCSTLIENRVHGLTFDPKELGQCAAAIRLMTSDPDLRQSLGSGLKEKVMNQYSKQMVVQSLLEIYKSVDGK